MTLQPASEVTGDTTARFKYEPVALHDRYAGRVLTECSLITATTAASSRLPAVQEWVKPLQQLITDPDGLPDRQTLKHSKTTQVFRAPLRFAGGSIDVICKRAELKSKLRRLVGGLARTRERRSFDRALRLLRAGIDTALPLALIERPFGSSEAWLITEAIPDAVDLEQLALIHLPRLSRRAASEVKKRLTPALVELFCRLETHRLHHRDLKASNLLITEWDSSAAPPRIWIVDLDGLASRRPFSGRARWQPLMRLAASLLGYPSVTHADHARFLKAYLDKSGAPQSEWRARLRELHTWANDYVRRARGRKRQKLDGYTGD